MQEENKTIIYDSISSVSNYRNSSTIQNDPVDNIVLPTNGIRIVDFIMPDKQDSDHRNVITFEVDVSLIPPFLKEICQEINLDQAEMVEELLIYAYEQFIQSLRGEDGTEKIREFIRSILRRKYIAGNISAKDLDIARSHSWLEELDIKNIKQAKLSYNLLIDNETSK